MGTTAIGVPAAGIQAARVPTAGIQVAGQSELLVDKT